VETSRAQVEPTSVDEWNAEDAVSGVLSAGDNPVHLDGDAARQMLDETIIELPQTLDWTELVRYVRENKAPADFQIPPDTTHFDYYVTEFPLTLIVPPNQRLVRLRLSLELSAPVNADATVVAYDLFPTTQTDVRTLMSGEVSVDVADGLQYALLAGGVPAPIAGITKCLGLKLSLPFKWTSAYATIQSSAKMSNPVVWSVTDDAMQGGFSASVIIRSPKGKPVNVSASLYGELRRRLLGLFEKAQFKTFEPRAYQVG
jgi:hypothetical protein